MTKSQSGKKSPCFGLWCCCGRYHHSDSYAAVTHHPSSPSAFACIGRQQTDQLSCYCEKGAVWFLWQPLPLCLSAWFVSLCLSLTHFPLFLSLFLHPCPSAPTPSLCPRSLPDEGKLMPEFIVGLRLLPAPLGSSAWLCGGGACCFKGTVYHTVPPLPPSCPVFSSLLVSTLPHYLLSHCLSSLCHSSVEGVISLKSRWSLPLLPDKQSPGTGCPKNPGCCIINIQSRLVFDDLISLRDKNRKGGPSWLSHPPTPPCPLYQNLYFYTMHSHT